MTAAVTSDVPSANESTDCGCIVLNGDERRVETCQNCVRKHIDCVEILSRLVLMHVFE